MDREQAFVTAIALIGDLPVNTAAIDFWDTPRVTRASDRMAWQDGANRLELIAQNVEPDIAFYFLCWASDAAVAVGEMSRALQLMPIPTIGTRQSMRASDRLNLKAELGSPLEARDITSLFGPKVTAFGRQHLASIESHIQLQLEAMTANDMPISIADWAADAHRHPAGYSLFNGHPSHIVTTPPAGWTFSLSKVAEERCVQMIREAENTWREECDLPRVGEGWVAETALFYALKRELPHLDLVQHYRPPWLGRQHLDIASPSLKSAIEYQGAQHDRPVAFFGGAEGFARTVERDQRKLHRCRRHGWRLIYVREGYQLADVISEIARP